MPGLRGIARRAVFRSGLLLALILGWAPPSGAETWTLNFREAEIEELIRFVADAVGVTVIVDPQVKGKVKVVSSRPVDTEELYDLFLSILEVHGYAAIRSGDVVRVVLQKDARTLAVPVATPRGGANSDSAEIVTQVVQLRNITAAKLIPILRPLAPQQAHLAAYAPGNAIIISDSAANISRIRQIIDRIDLAAIEQTEVIELQHASAQDIVSVLQALRPSRGEGEERKPVQLVPDPRSNSIVVSADELERERIRHLVSRLDRPAGPSAHARVRYLEYADAKDVAQVLKRVLESSARPGASGEGARSRNVVIEADEATNAIIVTAEPAEMPGIESVIDSLDIRRAQVLVEAIIVEMVADGLKDLGIQWLFSGERAFGGFAEQPGILGDAAEDAADGSVSATGTAAVLAASSGQLLGIADPDADGKSIVGVINALQDNKQANILSTPSLLTLDNSPASIVVGQQVPFLTGSFTQTGASDAQGNLNPFQTIQRESIGTKLDVTPHVNEGDMIVLDIVQEVSSLTGLEASDIITNERKIESRIMVRDGDIVVLGGLIEDNVQEKVRKVPLLGDIPVLGKLFRSTSTDSTKTNLVVFMRPTVIRDPALLQGATAKKYRGIRSLQLERREGGDPDAGAPQQPLLPEWEEHLREAEELRARGTPPPAPEP